MEKDFEIEICKNCENKFKGNFCNHCGQKAKIGKINSAFFLKELGGSIFYTDKGFFFTIKELAVRPGKAIKEFIDGKRIIYFKPISFVLIFAILYSILLYLFTAQTELQDLLSGIKDGLIKQSEQRKLGVQIFEWVINNYAYSILLLTPIFSFASYLAFYKSKRKYAENLLLNIFLIGEISFFLVLLAPFTIIFNDSYLLILFKILTVLTYTFFAFFQFFDTVRKSSRIINTVITFSLFMIFFMVGISILALITIKGIT